MHLLRVDGEQVALPVRHRLQARFVIEQRAADRLRTTALQLQAATVRQHAVDQLQLTLIQRLRLGQSTPQLGRQRQQGYAAAGQFLTPIEPGPAVGRQLAEVVQVQVAAVGQVAAAIETEKLAGVRMFHQLPA